MRHLFLSDWPGNRRRQPMGTGRGVFCQADADSPRKRECAPGQDVHYGNYHTQRRRYATTNTYKLPT